MRTYLCVYTPCINCIILTVSSDENGFFVIVRMCFNLLIIPIRIFKSGMTHVTDSFIVSRLGMRSRDMDQSRIEIFDHILVKFEPSYNNRQITYGFKMNFL